MSLFNPSSDTKDTKDTKDGKIGDTSSLPSLPFAATSMSLPQSQVNAQPIVKPDQEWNEHKNDVITSTQGDGTSKIARLPSKTHKLASPKAGSTTGIQSESQMISPLNALLSPSKS